MKSLFYILGMAAVLSLPSQNLLANDEPHGDYDANHCEFFVNSLADVSLHYGGGGYDETLLRSYVSVDSRKLVQDQGGRILRVGLWVNYDEFPGRPGGSVSRYNVTDWIDGAEIEPSYYKIDFTRFLIRGLSPSREHYRREIRGFAYFIVVKRANGRVERLWLKNGAANFTYESVFHGFPLHTENQGPNTFRYVQEPSPIYHQRRACKH